MRAGAIVGLAVAVLAVGAAGSWAGSDTGLVGYWHLDENGGTYAADSSGTGNDGTVIGHVQWVGGHSGSALSFDGSAARVEVADNPSLEPAAAVSVSAWVNHLGSPGDYRYVLAKGATGCIAASYGLYTGADGGLAFYISSGGGKSYQLSPDEGTRVWDGNWHLAVGTFDGSTVRLFVDGREVGHGIRHAGPLSYKLTDSNDLFIADYPGCHARNFVGLIDEPMVFTRALTAEEVAAAMDQSADGPGAPAPVPAPEPQPPAPGASLPAPSGQPLGPVAGDGPIGAPALAGLHVSPRAFRVPFRGHGSRRTRTAGATVTYTDTQVADSAFRVLLARTGIRRAGRCIKPSRGSRTTHGRHCVRYIAVGRFVHADHPGTNRFLLPVALQGRRLTPSHYRLEATPRAHNRAGPTATSTFTIVGSSAHSNALRRGAGSTTAAGLAGPR